MAPIKCAFEYVAKGFIPLALFSSQIKLTLSGGTLRRCELYMSRIETVRQVFKYLRELLVLNFQQPVLTLNGDNKQLSTDI